MSIIAPEAPSEHNRQSILVGNAPVGKRIRAPALTPQPDVHRAAVPSLLPLSLMPSPPYLTGVSQRLLTQAAGTPGGGASPHRTLPGECVGPLRGQTLLLLQVRVGVAPRWIRPLPAALPALSGGRGSEEPMLRLTILTVFVRLEIIKDRAITVHPSLPPP